MSVAVVGVDVGGTFTDFAVLRDGRLEVYKLPSTPSDPSRGILQGVSDLSVGEASYVHGSTVATNALLERRGARTALVTTHGFEDVLEIGRQNRPDLYDLGMDRPPALVPAELRFGVSERVDQAGAVVATPRPEELSKLVSTLDDAQVDAVAVVLLFSFLNPLHEELVAEALAGLKSNPYVSVSSQVVPEFREYERTSTVVVNSYVGPLMSRYISQLETALGAGLRIMQSSGGSITVQLASNQPVRTILSGPAGGVVGAFHLASQAGYDDVITLDMGGTSTDVSLCPGVIKETTSSSLAGCPISVPMIEIHSVGAGGGSISRLDEGGALVVGPQSAGADPGPACYGVGDQVTVTDANLILGRLPQDQPLAGKLQLHYQRAHDLLSALGAGLGGDARAAALGVVRVVNATMERAIRTISLERGYDPRRFTLVAFGGAGPAHACELAQELGIPRVLVPPHPGILSALGVGIADIVRDYSRTVMMRGSDMTKDRLDAGFAVLEDAATAEMADEGLPVGRLVMRRFLDVRYVGTVLRTDGQLPHPHRWVRSSRSPRFSPRSQPTVRLLRSLGAGGGSESAPQDADPRGQAGTSRGPARGKRLQCSPGCGNRGCLPARGVAHQYLYQRDLLHHGNVIQGPAVVLQMDSTTSIPPGWTAQVDGYGNLVVEPTG